MQHLNQLFNLAGKVALVTGGGSGIGRALATALTMAGANVIVLGRRKDYLETTVKHLEKIGSKGAYAWEFDLLEREKIPTLASEITKKLGSPDILVNAAGVNYREQYQDVSSSTWDKTIELNLNAPFFMSRAFIPGMEQRKWGKIINIASLQAKRAFPDSMPYGASKGGLCQLTRAMAEAWSSAGISCNCIAPGFFPTELTSKVFANDVHAEALAKQTAVGRNGALSDLHGSVIFLSSHASDFVTGQTIFVDGGFSAK